MINEIFVKVEGLNLSRIAQKMIENGLFVSNLKIKKTYMLFSIKEKDKSKLGEILKREHKSYYIVKNTKLKRFFAKLPYFIGSFLPFLMLFAFFYKVYGTILNVYFTPSFISFNLADVSVVLFKNLYSLFNLL